MQGIQATLDRYAREQEEKVAEERKLIEQVPLKDRRSVFPGSFGARGEATRDLRGVARKLAAGEATRVVVLAGAGMSVSAGIPDFRSPDGLYALLGQQQRGGAKTADPSGVFRMGCFKKDPVTTNAVLRAMVPDSGRYSPTPAHYFAKMLHERGLLQKLYTQNVDALERAAGLPEAKVVYAHGGFHGAHCIEHGPASKRFSSLGRDTGHGTPCNAQYSLEEWRAAVENPAPGDAAGVLRCCARTGPRGGDGRRAVCGGLVKPDITFFGEQTSALSLYDMIRDMEQADLVIVMGTSLAVHPFNKLVVMTGKTVPRVLINREQVGAAPVLEDGFAWDLPDLNYRDVFLQGDCDAVVTALCQAVDAEAAAAPPAPPPPAAAAATAARGGAAAAAAAAAVDQGSWAEHLERLVEAGPQSDVWQMLLEQQPAGIRPAGR
eukprot:SAG22_NODE_2543_length_2462_cov_2.798561_1_plen_434_part_00